MNLPSASRIPSMLVLVAAVLARGELGAAQGSEDLSIVALFDGERSEPLNTWGGAWETGTTREVFVQTECVRSGRRALGVELGRVEAGARCHLQCFASGFGRSRQHYQTRDLLRYERLEFHARNATQVALGGTLQIKDYRDSPDHRAIYRFSLPAGEQWTRVDVPLALSGAGWTLEGQPDLGRVLTIDFVFQPRTALRHGRVYLDDLVLVEPEGPLDINTAPLPELVERLARRQWDALWAARSRDHGLLPNHSYQSADAGLNVTAAVLWMLPTAVRRQWVGQKEADDYAALVVETIARLLDRARHLPPRSVDWVTLQPSLLPEESSVDAAFLALALHRYRAFPSLRPALCQTIQRVQERFDFASFARPAGWSMAYRYASRHSREGLVELTYDGYTNEAKVIALAAHLAGRHPVPIESRWNTDVHRARAHLAGFQRTPVVHSLGEFRAPFAQALLNLFVDVRALGVDSYPDGRLATNPWENFVCYEQNVMARLAELGRAHLVQPDAGDDGTLNNYQQFSLYHDFGEHDLFMPWSASFALLAGADGAEESLRFLLRHRLHGPLGLADSAKWKTGAAEPYTVTARHDFWNTALSTMALLEWLDGDARASKAFAELPDVGAALDRVFHPTTSSRLFIFPGSR